MCIKLSLQTMCNKILLVIKSEENYQHREQLCLVVQSPGLSFSLLLNCLVTTPLFWVTHSAL